MIGYALIVYFDRRATSRASRVLPHMKISRLRFLWTGRGPERKSDLPRLLWGVRVHRRALAALGVRLARARARARASVGRSSRGRAFLSLSRFAVCLLALSRARRARACSLLADAARARRGRRCSTARPRLVVAVAVFALRLLVIARPRSRPPAPGRVPDCALLRARRARAHAAHRFSPLSSS